MSLSLQQGMEEKDMPVFFSQFVFTRYILIWPMMVSITKTPMMGSSVMTEWYEKILA